MLFILIILVFVFIAIVSFDNYIERDLEKDKENFKS